MFIESHAAKYTEAVVVIVCKVTDVVFINIPLFLPLHLRFTQVCWRRNVARVLVSILLPEKLVGLVSLAVVIPNLADK